MKDMQAQLIKGILFSTLITVVFALVQYYSNGIVGRWSNTWGMYTIALWPIVFVVPLVWFSIWLAINIIILKKYGWRYSFTALFCSTAVSLIILENLNLSLPYGFMTWLPPTAAVCCYMVLIGAARVLLQKKWHAIMFYVITVLIFAISTIWIKEGGFRIKRYYERVVSAVWFPENPSLEFAPITVERFPGSPFFYEKPLYLQFEAQKIGIIERRVAKKTADSPYCPLDFIKQTMINNESDCVYVGEVNDGIRVYKNIGDGMKDQAHIYAVFGETLVVITGSQLVEDKLSYLSSFKAMPFLRVSDKLLENRRLVDR